ncbi:MAG TPA: cation transporter [Spirochaeta sp.]|nr:cation transporter [Spirochaeta sp.]
MALFLGLLIWLGLNGSLGREVLITGIIVTVITSFFYIGSGVFRDVHLTPRALIALIAWIIVFLIELVKSNIDVMSRVVTPKVRINPAIVQVKTKLRSRLGRLALANSITLTPGTLTADIVDDTLFIHWIDASTVDIDEATRKIVEKFEKHLEVLFG